MNTAQDMAKVAQKQRILMEGIELLGKIQIELGQARASADAWGMVAVVSNATLIPLNAIINAFELGAAKSAYQILVRELYGKFAKSGTRLDGHGKTALSLAKQAIVGELKRKALTAYVPGVNILVGLAEDSLATWQAAKLVDTGSREMAARVMALDRQIVQSRMQLQRLGIQLAEMYAAADLYRRTA